MTDSRSYIVYDTIERYVMPGPNQIRFISSGQTLSVVLGSCISTVFVGKAAGYIAAANHIVIARKRDHEIIKYKSAQQQIDDILNAFLEVYKIPIEDIICLHLVGAGTKISDGSFNIHAENIKIAKDLLSEREMDIYFDDTGSYFFANYSLSGKNISIFIEDQLSDTHISYSIDLDMLFSLRSGGDLIIPASGLKQPNEGFEDFINRKIIILITGERNRQKDWSGL